MGAGSAATIYGGSAYGNSIAYAEQNGFTDSQAKAYASKMGESAVASGVGSFGMAYIDQTVVTPEILKSTLGEDVAVDHKEAIKEAALDDLITGAAAYVYSKSIAEPVSGEQNIYENAHALEKINGRNSNVNPSSKKLRENMIADGQIEPNYKNAAHHIVAGTSPKADEARCSIVKLVDTV